MAFIDLKARVSCENCGHIHTVDIDLASKGEIIDIIQNAFCNDTDVGFYSDDKRFWCGKCFDEYVDEHTDAEVHELINGKTK